MNIYKAFLFTALLTAIDIAISFSAVYIMDFTDFEDDSIRHFLGIIDIIPFMISFSIILFLIWKVKVPWNTTIEKVKNINGHIVLYLLILNVGLFIYDRPSFDFTRIIATINNIPIDPFVNKEINGVSLFYEAISVLIVAPIFEELFFRKYMFVALQKKYSLNISILISSICFSLVHLPSYSNLIPTFLFGVCCCIVYSRTKNILYTMFLHSLLNLNWLIAMRFGENYYNWIFELKFNFIYWLFVLMGILMVLFALRQIIIASSADRS